MMVCVNVIHKPKNRVISSVRKNPAMDLASFRRGKLLGLWTYSVSQTGFRDVFEQNEMVDATIAEDSGGSHNVSCEKPY